MNCRRRVCATVITAAAFFLCCVWMVAGRAWAGDDDDARAMLFSGRDIWRNGVFAYGGFVFAPGGLEQDGLLLKVLLSGGLYRYDAENLGGVRVIGTEWLCANTYPVGGSNAAMPSSSFSWDQNFRNTVSRQMTPPISCAEIHSACGRRSTLWYEPTPDTMVAADVSLSSIATSNSARVRLRLASIRRNAGWRLSWPGNSVFWL